MGPRILIIFSLLCLAGYGVITLNDKPVKASSSIQEEPLIMTDQSKQNHTSNPVEKIQKSDAEWKQQLSDQQYHVLREKGTERAFSGEYWDEKRKGTYACAGCGLPLFEADTKYESGTGWPSFYQPVSDQNVDTEEDNSLFMRRTEVLCARCGGHLGHVFPDGPKPTGMRYCINSASLDFKPNEE